MQAQLPGTRVQACSGVASRSTAARPMRLLNLEPGGAARWSRVAGAPYRDENDLYALARSVDWRLWIDPRQTLREDTTAQRPPLRSLNFATCASRTALCDMLRDATGERPSVDVRQPDLPLALHLGPRARDPSTDTSGEPLFKRGWRVDKGDAPLKETLAAAMLAAAGWRGTPEAGGALHDPVRGSGTIAIEATQIACGIAPGRCAASRFERLGRSPTEPRTGAPAGRGPGADAREPGPDLRQRHLVPDGRLRAPQRRACRRGWAIEFNGGDALERPAPPLPPGLAGTLMLNPPYGERIQALAGRPVAPPVGRGPRDAGGFLPAPGRALEACLHRPPGPALDGLR